MLDRVKNLANLMRLKKEQGDGNFVLMLGAGASISSGVPPTRAIMEQLLQTYGNGNEGATVEQRFDQLWKRTSNGMRQEFLRAYLEPKTLSDGYRKLAELIKAGYFDLVLSFNFDNLLETALQDVEIRRVIRGETSEEAMQTLLDAREPRVKLVKLHGSLASAEYFLFDAREMHKYPPPIESLVANITGHDVVVCGYAFNDFCVVRAFAEEGGSIVCVDPGGVPRALSAFLEKRRSEDNEIQTDFDTFFSALHRELLYVAPADEEKPPPNPFKFLESYDIGDAGTFAGRDDEAETFFNFLAWDPAPRVLVIAGPGKAGKSSLVRAGLLARLDPARHLGLYLRCQPTIEETLPAALTRLDGAPAGLEIPPGTDLPDALRRLGAASPDRRVVLFLDQFERVTDRFDSSTRQGKRALSDFLAATLLAGSDDNLTLVLAVTDDGVLGATILQECAKQQLTSSIVLCQPFGRDDVVGIMQTVATRAGFAFDAEIFEEMADSFEQTKRSASAEKRFTLAHMHAVCHILAGTRRVSHDAFRATFGQQNLDVLHQAINVCEFTSFVEDRSLPDADWLRNMLKVPLKESKERIAQFIKAHYDELQPRQAPNR